MHYEYCTSGQFDRLQHGPIDVAFPDSSAYKAGDFMVLSESIPGKPKGTRIMVALIEKTIKGDKIPQGYIGLTLVKWKL